MNGAVSKFLDLMNTLFSFGHLSGCVGAGVSEQIRHISRSCQLKVLKLNSVLPFGLSRISAGDQERSGLDWPASRGVDAGVGARAAVDDAVAAVDDGALADAEGA